MSKPRLSTLCALLILLGSGPGLPALAQTRPPTNTPLVEAELPTMVAIEDRLNAAGLCTPLQFDLRTISGLLGFPIPTFIPIDTHLRWDQSRHRVTRFSSSPTEVELDFKLGCQPSTNGVALDFLGLAPDKVRLDDDVRCIGDRMPDGELGTLACKVDGKIGRFLSKNIIGLSAKVGKLLPMNLAVPVAGSAAMVPGVGSAAEGPSGGPEGSSAANSDAALKPAAGSLAPYDAGTSTSPAKPSDAANDSAAAARPATVD